MPIGTIHCRAARWVAAFGCGFNRNLNERRLLVADSIGHSITTIVQQGELGYREPQETYFVRVCQAQKWCAYRSLGFSSEHAATIFRCQVICWFLATLESDLWILSRKIRFCIIEESLAALRALVLSFVATGIVHDLVMMAVRQEVAFLFTPWFLFLGIGVVLSKVMGMDIGASSWRLRAVFHSTYLSACLALAFLIFTVR